MVANIEPLWTTHDVARYLRVKPTTVTAMARNKEIPSIRMGRLYRFRKDEIASWLEEKQHHQKETGMSQ